jgi:hypothetical protein
VPDRTKNASPAKWFGQCATKASISDRSKCPIARELRRWPSNSLIASWEICTSGNISREWYSFGRGQHHLGRRAESQGALSRSEKHRHPLALLCVR